ncbi:conserved protein of unknown function (plasmid) [Candidatus Promineifilum breve]|uniref:Uncharacterized protein n=1 Tax=Candidatus Promineifilum breve TaxID=1806508 RepID=A0A161JMZ7_9CHLR|nr:hypothetical protein [Candidatus Promineifilum breve]CUS06403.1 conserved protein of unknown function [Candidatus Promineifilum breve]
MTDFIDSPTPPTQEGAKHDLLSASWYPYDASDEWRQSWPSPPAAPAGDWAVAAARGIIHNLLDRRAIKRGFEDVDEDVRLEIVETIAMIIRTAPGWYEQQEEATP